VNRTGDISESSNSRFGRFRPSALDPSVSATDRTCSRQLHARYVPARSSVVTGGPEVTQTPVRVRCAGPPRQRHRARPADGLDDVLYPRRKPQRAQSIVDGVASSFVYNANRLNFKAARRRVRRGRPDDLRRPGRSYAFDSRDRLITASRARAAGTYGYHPDVLSLLSHCRRPKHLVLRGSGVNAVQGR